MENRSRLCLLSVIKPFFLCLCSLETTAHFSKKRIGTTGNGLKGNCFNFDAVLEKKRAGMRRWRWAALLFLRLFGSNATECPPQFLKCKHFFSVNISELKLAFIPCSDWSGRKWSNREVERKKTLHKIHKLFLLVNQFRQKCI